MRQRIRKTLLLFSFLLFPVIIWYFSPYLIIVAAMDHIINGSFIVFLLMLLLSMFLGRSWCGFFCPAGGMRRAMPSGTGKAGQAGQDQIRDLERMDHCRNRNLHSGQKRCHGAALFHDRPRHLRIEHQQLCDILWDSAFPRTARPDPWEKSHMPLLLLDGAFHGHWKQDRKIASSPAASHRSRRKFVHRLREVQPGVRDGAGCQETDR